MTVATTTPVPANAQAKAEWPDIHDAKAIAEEGFIYGLPIAMNYAIMYEYAADRNSGQLKAPFNQIKAAAACAASRAPYAAPASSSRDRSPAFSPSQCTLK
jgi:hypothetical protein